MIARDTDSIFRPLERLLSDAVGKANALTLQDLADRLLVDRREVEQTIEQRLLDFPWPLVAGNKGIYIPTEAEEINRYLHSLHTRHRRMQIREATVRRKAKAAGYPEENGEFVNPPQAAQSELFQ
ncbi:MAG: hypothetical protein HQ559_13585 [Lentisphaerae bacterium]|nr:hypothetical protein [Lentisphaerota bacterium]